jgi:hypothetical protein
MEERDNVIWLRGSKEDFENGKGYFAAEFGGDGSIHFHERCEFSGEEHHNFALSKSDFDKLKKEMEKYER